MLQPSWLDWDAASSSSTLGSGNLFGMCVQMGGSEAKEEEGGKHCMNSLDTVQYCIYLTLLSCVQYRSVTYCVSVYEQHI